MIEIDESGFDTEVIAASHEQLVLVDFWAPWCGPCRMLGPVLEQAEARASGKVRLVKINSDENMELSARFGVRSIPFVLAFRDGEPVDQFVGALPLGQVEAFIERLLPRPGAESVASGLRALADGRYEEAADALAQALALDPDNEELRADASRALVHAGRADEAAAAFEPLRPKSTTDKRLGALALIVDGCAEAAPVDDTEVARAAAAAREALCRADWPQAMDAALRVVQTDRAWHDEAGRRLMLAAFEFCDDKALVSGFRRKLAASLN